MISISGKKWEQRKINNNSIEKIKQDHNFSEILSRLIIARNFDKNEIFSINNDLDIKNIFLNNVDFIQSIDLLVDVISKQEKICILGDYDVDGSAATSLFVRYFKSLNYPFYFYIPDREKDGYGASIKLFEKLILKKPKLIIMLDCGSTSNDAVQFLNDNNIKSLIIDHHEINKPYPKANAIINPKKDNGYIEFDYLCATALTYFFLDSLSKKIINPINLNDFLIYVLLATVCDVMPIRKLNRQIAITVFKKFDISKNHALKKLYELKKKKNKININDIGFFIGPILNAGGRLGKSAYATQLLSSNDLNFINKRSLDLVKMNEVRKKIETSILDEINFKEIENENKDIIIYFNPSINEGLIGIIAARLKDYFNKPAVVITQSNNLLKGSARSIDDYNIGRVVKYALDKNIILYGGGHNMAAGFSLKKENLTIFKEFFFNNFNNAQISKNNLFKFDAEISSIAFNKNFFSEIKKIEPFGTGNLLPVFLFKDLKIIKAKILNDKHISLILKSKIGYSINSISFNSVNTKLGECLLNYKKNLNVLGEINENFWNNKYILQLTIRDIIL
jgi:single-stranded-DNA-specific exonuclease